MNSLYQFIQGRRIRQKLELVEKKLLENLNGSFPIIREMSEYIFRSGGKRLRPAFLLLAAEMLGYEGEQDVDLAVAVEYIHTATLIHDDVIDHAEKRRSMPTLNRKWDANSSILFGDFIYAKTIEDINKFQNYRLNDWLANLTLKIILGELKEYENKFNINLTKENYLEIISLKTGELFAQSARLAAIIADKDERTEGLLARAGMKMGIAFQIIDDLLDYLSKDEILGKPTCIDLQEGKLTLPAFYLIESNEEYKQQIKTLFEKRDFDLLDQDQFRKAIIDLGIDVKVKADAAKQINEGLELLDGFPRNKAFQSLEKMAKYFYQREI